MKTYIKIKLKLLIILIFVNITFSQNGGEVFVINKSSISTILVKVYPVSMIFNNDWIRGTSQVFRNYNLIARSRGFDPRRDFLNGMNINEPTELYWPISNNLQDNFIAFECDYIGASGNGTKGSLGLGIYRFDIYWNCNEPEDEGPPPCLPDDYFTLELDNGYPHHTPTGTCNDGDIHIEFRNPDGNGNRVYYRWVSCTCPGYDGNWKPCPENRSILERNRCVGQIWEPNYGDFRYNLGTINAPNPYNFIPLEPRYDCSSQWVSGAGDQNHFYRLNNNIGLLPFNLTIEKSVETRTISNEEILYYLGPPSITIRSDAKLKIAKGSNNTPTFFTFKKYLYHNFGTNLNTNTNGTLELESSDNYTTRAEINSENYGNFHFYTGSNLVMGRNAQINLIANSSITFYSASHVQIEAQSHVNIYSGCTVYDCGLIMSFSNPNNFFLIYPGGHYYYDPQYCNINPGAKTFENEQNLIVDGGNLTIGADSKIIFNGTGTKMQVSSGSTIFMGQGA